MKRTTNNIILLLCLAGCKTTTYQNPHIQIETQFGDIELELFPKKST